MNKAFSPSASSSHSGRRQFFSHFSSCLESGRVERTGFYLKGFRGVFERLGLEFFTKVHQLFRNFEEDVAEGLVVVDPAGLAPDLPLFHRGLARGFPKDFLGGFEMSQAHRVRKLLVRDVNVARATRHVPTIEGGLHVQARADREVRVEALREDLEHPGSRFLVIGVLPCVIWRSGSTEEDEGEGEPPFLEPVPAQGLVDQVELLSDRRALLALHLGAHARLVAENDHPVAIVVEFLKGFEDFWVERRPVFFVDGKSIAALGPDERAVQVEGRHLGPPVGAPLRHAEALVDDAAAVLVEEVLPRPRRFRRQGVGLARLGLREGAFQLLRLLLRRRHRGLLRLHPVERDLTLGRHLWSQQQKQTRSTDRPTDQQADSSRRKLAPDPRMRSRNSK
mmetsp:Transcript_35323/g.76679  ORF Transcript_35323/g.76679 Transcript_35323/m.76679 type:complete len:393 (+) Transcript_35323:385-1563(+)